MAFYTSLNHTENEIRLLRVDLSDAGQHELISKVSLRSKRQQYQALSYTWGDENKRTNISLNGQTFQVSESLNEALNGVRAFWRETYPLEGKPLFLWCDQICIDQFSGEEKNRQVAYMSEIYRRAEQVLIWLPVRASVSSGFDDWTRWKSWHESQAQVKATDLQAGYTSPRPMQYLTRHLSSQSLTTAWDNVREIAESPWWSRAWVYQEFLLATRATFLIAGLVAPWGELQEVLTCFVSNAQLHADVSRAAVADVERKAIQLESTLDKQQRQWEKDVEQGDDPQAGCGAQCHAWHASSEKYLTFNPLREKSLFSWMLNKWTEIMAREGNMSTITKTAYYLGAVCVISSWGPVALVEYILVIICAPIVWAFTLWPESTHKKKELDQRRIELTQQAEEGQKNATEMRRIANDLLGPHQASLSLMPRSCNTAQSLMSSKAQILEGNFAPLSQLMRHARNCQCRDQRDKIFAFLGVAGSSYDIVADYSPTNTLHDVVTRATAAVITTEGSLNILNDAKEEGEVSTVLDHLPSWVPNFTTPDRVNVEYQEFIKGIQLPPSSDLSASKGTPPMVSFHADRHGNPDRVLRARGIRIGRLTRIVRDPVPQPWRLFEDDWGREIGTRHDARPGDEVWVLFGADVPFTLTKPSMQDDSYQVLGQAMIWEDGKPSSILHGSMIAHLASGTAHVSTEDISLI